MSPIVPAALSAFAAGVASSHWLDPAAGRRRRAQAFDKLHSLANSGGENTGVVLRDLAHRSRGMVYSAAVRFSAEDADDRVVGERVRAELGFLVSHPRAIEVVARDGRVNLEGAVLARELDQLLSGIRRVRGVREVDHDRLEVHEEPDVPSLQGGVERSGRVPELLQRRWSPTTRLLVGTSSMALAVAALRRPSPLRIAAAALGLAAVARSATNLEFRRLTGIGAGRRAVDIHKSMPIAAPIETVFALWSEIENFPRFMSHVREVRRVGPDRYEWHVDGPAGVPVRWQAQVTARVSERLLAWRTVEGSLVATAGRIRFERTPDNSSRIHLELSYNPPGGAIAAGLAAFLGGDPRRQLDDDLLRFQSLAELGRTTGRGEAVSIEEVRGQADEPGTEWAGSR